MQRKVLSELEKHGAKGRVVSIHRLAHLEKDIEEKRSRGLLHRELYKNYLSGFRFKPPESLADAKSIIVVAYPQPQFRVFFKFNGNSYPAIIPPTYLYYPDKRIYEMLSSFLGPWGYHLTTAVLPLKLLAVRSGLGRYGKNNICYVEGMGSFHRLMAFYSDFPCSEDLWVEARVMESCKKCLACQRGCPTGAIQPERFLIRADRCLTFLNEGLSDFPSWVDPTWHNCLVGCLRCQTACFQNNAFLSWIDDKTEFSEQETAFILENTPFELLASDTQEKLEQLNLIEYYKILPRNLSVLLGTKL